MQKTQNKELKQNKQNKQSKQIELEFEPGIADCYKGLIVLNSKLDQLLMVLNKVADIAESKQNGTATFM